MNLKESEYRLQRSINLERLGKDMSLSLTPYYVNLFIYLLGQIRIIEPRIYVFF